MKQSYIQHIEKTVREHCKELQELSMGCEIVLRGRKYKLVKEPVEYYSPHPRDKQFGFTTPFETQQVLLDKETGEYRISGLREKCIVEILGHPIMPHHILRTMGEKWAMAGDGQILYRLNKEGFVGEKHCAIQTYIYKVSFCKFDLSLSWKEQEEPVLKFLAETMGYKQ